MAWAVLHHIDIPHVQHGLGVVPIDAYAAFEPGPGVLLVGGYGPIGGGAFLSSPSRPSTTVFHRHPHATTMHLSSPREHRG
jgi:hypothetical protein